MLLKIKSKKLKKLVGDDAAVDVMLECEAWKSKRTACRDYR